MCHSISHRSDASTQHRLEACAVPAANRRMTPARVTASATSGSTVAARREPRLSRRHWRSEEHTSELQSLTNLVCRLLLEKKKTQKYSEHQHTYIPARYTR